MYEGLSVGDPDGIEDDGIYVGDFDGLLGITVEIIVG